MHQTLQCVQGAYGELAFEEFDKIYYIVQPKIFFKLTLTCQHT